MNYSKYTLKNSSKELNSVTKKQPKLKLNFISTSLLLTSLQNLPPFKSFSVVRKNSTHLLPNETESQILWRNRDLSEQPRESHGGLSEDCVNFTYL